MSSITLGILTFNEGDLLERLLQQISPFVDEIIVVDSFSSDNTVDVANRFGATILQAPMYGSYCNMRNLIINAARSDYILMMDCDETLENPKEFFSNEFTEDAYLIPRKNFLDNVQFDIDNKDFQGRLFKNNSKIKYYRSVHELLTGYERIVQLDSWILHYKTTENYLNNHYKYKKILDGESMKVEQVDMSNDSIFKGWYQYEEFPNGAASRWCSDKGTVTFECNDPAAQAVCVLISTVGKFNKCRITIKAGTRVVGKLEFEPEVGKFYIPINVSTFAPCKLTMNIKCWDEREFVPEVRTLGIFVDKIWYEDPGVTGTLNLIWEPEKKFTITGDPQDNGIMPCILASNYWETATQMVIDRFVTKDNVCLDVGANIGSIAIPLAEKAKKVFAFEVGKIPLGYLRKNILQNGITNIEVVKGAVSDGPADLFYHYTFPNVGGSFVSDTLHEGNALVEEIQAFSLDSMIDSFTRVDFIKMDIEGFELNALLGAKKLLKKFNPKLFIEFNPVAFRDIHGKNIRPLWDFLAKNFEYIYVVREDGFRRVKTFNEAIADIDLETRTLEDLLCSNEEIKL